MLNVCPQWETKFNLRTPTNHATVSGMSTVILIMDFLCIKYYIVSRANIFLIMRKGQFKSIFSFVIISVSVGCLCILASNSPISAQDLANDSSVLHSCDRAIPDFSGLVLDYRNDSSVAQRSDMPFDLDQLGNLLTGKAILGTIGVSMVENVAISGVQLINEDTISVTLRHDIENNTVLPITVIAYKISLNNSDIGSVMQSASNSNNFMGFNPSMNSLLHDNGTSSLFAEPRSTSQKNKENPLAIFDKIQIGSSSLTNPNWVSPNTVTMSMIKNLNYHSNFDFILVMAIPYTGIQSMVK
jgi:hypothetical protein